MKKDAPSPSYIILKNEMLYVDFTEHALYEIYYDCDHVILNTNGVIENKIIGIVTFGKPPNLVSEIIIKNCAVHNLVKQDIQDYPVTLENNTFFD